MTSTTLPPRGRWAPSPTGLLHVGSARTALVAWLSVRSRGGSFVWRVEDLDPPREVPGMALAARDDLTWLGLDWDEGPDVGGVHAPYEQSRRTEIYDRAIAFLAMHDRLFPCRLSRKDLQQLATAPHGSEGLPPYPPDARPRQLAPDWFDSWRRGEKADAALRFRVSSGPVSFDDRVAGRVTQHVDREVGDFVLKRRDGLFAYQLAVVVDDLAMGITEVVRGSDLLESTGRQLQLIEALRPLYPDAPVPTYMHLPLLLNPAGEKLSKRDGSVTLASLREAGVDATQLVGWLGASLGLLEQPRTVTARQLVALFDESRLAENARGQGDSRLPEDLASFLRSL